jgi:REP element-mobilizing transposase RayT
VNTKPGNKQIPFWQRGYYEHVIRNEKEFNEIGEYILGNPLKWELDRENPYSIKKVKPLLFEC